MTSQRLLVRVGIALVAFVLVSVGLVAGFGALAMAVEWRFSPGDEMEGPSIMVDRNGTPIYRFAAEVERRPVDLDQISPHLRNAVVAVEDHRFYEHEGVDAFGVVRAVVRNTLAGEIKEGASTLTQQYVKNTIVGSELSYARKAREAVIAMQLEEEKSKDEILESYLNNTYFGAGAYGAQSAAQDYFGVDASELDVAQAATLAATVTAPTRLSPRNNRVVAQQRRDMVVDRMEELDMISSEQALDARAQPLDVREREKGDHAAPYYVEAVRQQLLDDPHIGPDRLYYGGLTITAALDLGQQQRLEASIGENIPDNPDLDAGVAVVEPSTGDVIASYGGRDFEESNVDLALRGSSGRPSGSTYKFYALAAALEDEWTLESSYPAPGRVTIGDWSPTGNGGCGTPCPLLEATVRSSNTVFAQLANDLGGERFNEMARRLGSRQQFSDPEIITHVLGPGPVTPLDIASSMATLANDGVACPARLVTEVRDAEGTPLPPPDPRQPSPEERERWEEHLDELGYDLDDLDEEEGDEGRCYRAVPASVARAVTHALEQVIERGTGTNAQIDRPAAGKTGTAQNSNMIWFSGYTRTLAMSVSFGGRDSLVPLENLPGCSGPCFGGDLTATMWAHAAEQLHQDLPAAEFQEMVPDEREGGAAAGGRALREPSGIMPPEEPDPAPTPPPPPDTDPSPPSPPSEEDPGPVELPEPPEQGSPPPPTRDGEQEWRHWPEDRPRPEQPPGETSPGQSPSDDWEHWPEDRERPD